MIVKDTVIVGDERTMTMTTVDAILTRDQRTTSHRVFDHATQSHASSSMISSSQQTKSRMEASHRYATRTKEEDHSRRHLRCESYHVPTFYDDRGIQPNTKASIITCLRLGALLLILLMMSVQGAPTMNLREARWSTPPKWVDPCGSTNDNNETNGEEDVIQIPDEQLLNQIITQAKTALLQAQLFRDDFVKHSFHIDYVDLRCSWNDRYSWLPNKKQIPKELGEKLDQEYLDSLKFDTVLVETYQYVQRFAMGLEQVTWDQEDDNLRFCTYFQKAEYQARMVLCELLVAIMEHVIQQPADITRDVMTPELRTMPHSTHRMLRDWIIFREYINCLEYMVQVYEHLLKNLES